MVQKFLITTLIVILLGITAKAQEKKVAVFDPAGEVEKYLKEIIREEISSIVVNTPDYTVLERQLIDKVLEENKFQMGGLVDDSQISEIGKRMGANYVFVTNITVIDGGNLYISYKMIDVQTARIEKQKTGQSSKKTNELIASVQKIVKEMFGTVSKTITEQNNIKTNEVSSWNPDGIEMIYVEGKRSGLTSIESFYIGKFEITQAQWKAIMGNNPSKFSGCENCPVEKVSWNDVQEFIKKLNAKTNKKYRLPTEIEWEYAAKGGKESQGYTYSGSNNIDDVAWYQGNTKSRTHEVGRKDPNELGIYDMTGNVWEWTKDCYNKSCEDRTLKGGSYDYGEKDCKISHRSWSTPNRNISDYGFRLVLEP
jgi:hypothetical protein